MTAGSSGIKKGLSAAFMAIVLFLLFLIPAFYMPTAYADESVDGNVCTLSNDGPIDLYYISDCLAGEEMCNELVNYGVVNNYELYYKEHSEFWKSFCKDVHNPEYDIFSEIEDAHVILDIRYGFNIRDSYEYYDYWGEYYGIEDYCGINKTLKKFFSDLKDRNCKIMFICGTDECRFGNDNEFLDYVDIHINTDRISNFIANIFYRVEQASVYGTLENCTFILDKCFAPINANLDDDIDPIDYYISSEVFEGWFIRNYFLTYVKTIYESEIRYGGQAVEDIFYDFNINVIYHTDGGDYYDLFRGRLNNTSDYDFCERYLRDRYVCAIGGTWEGTSYLDEWWFTIQEMRDLSGNVFPMYIFNANNNDFLIYEASGMASNFFWDKAAHNEDFFDVVLDFMTDADLSQYDNWQGRCVVTHKIRFITEDGWLFNLYSKWGDMGDWASVLEIDVFEGGWSVVMAEEEYNYFYGMYNLSSHGA